MAVLSFEGLKQYFHTSMKHENSDENISWDYKLFVQNQ